MRTSNRILAFGSLAAMVGLVFIVKARAQPSRNLADAFQKHVVEENTFYIDRSVAHWSAGGPPPYTKHRTLFLRGISREEAARLLRRLRPPSEGWTWTSSRNGEAATRGCERVGCWVPPARGIEDRNLDVRIEEAVPTTLASLEWDRLISRGKVQVVVLTSAVPTRVTIRRSAAKAMGPAKPGSKKTAS